MAVADPDLADCPVIGALLNSRSIGMRVGENGRHLNQGCCNDPKKLKFLRRICSSPAEAQAFGNQYPEGRTFELENVRRVDTSRIEGVAKTQKFTNRLTIFSVPSPSGGVLLCSLGVDTGRVSRSDAAAIQRRVCIGDLNDHMREFARLSWHATSVERRTDALGVMPEAGAAAESGAAEPGAAAESGEDASPSGAKQLDLVRLQQVLGPGTWQPVRQFGGWKTPASEPGANFFEEFVRAAGYCIVQDPDYAYLYYIDVTTPANRSALPEVFRRCEKRVRELRRSSLDEPVPQKQLRNTRPRVRVLDLVTIPGEGPGLRAG